MDDIRRLFLRLYNQPFCYSFFPKNTFIVYFEKVNPGDWRRGLGSEIDLYVFCLRDPKIKEKIWEIHKELAEYVFHPSRVNLEDL
jgi:hypothetical protein